MVHGEEKRKIAICVTLVIIIFFCWYFWRSKVGEISILVDGHVHYLWIGEGNVRCLWVEGGSRTNILLAF